MEQVTDLLNALAQKLGVSIEYLWPLLVKKTIYDSIIGLTYCIVLPIILGIVFKICLTKSKKEKIQYLDNDDMKIITTGIGIIFAIITVTGVILAGHFISGLCSPEATTISQLIQGIR